MRLHALLVPVLLAVHARAASVPQLSAKPGYDPQPDIPANEIFSPDVEGSESNVKDTENNLRTTVPVNDIPVKVLVENPAVKKVEKGPLDELNFDEENTEIKRVEIDIKNPGEPQRQEHETQNPVTYHYGDVQQAITSIKQNIEDSQTQFNEKFQKVSQGLQNWFTTNENFVNFQESIENLQTSFQNQISKLNQTIQGYLSPQASVPEVVPPPSNIKSVEKRLQLLDDNFQIGVKALSEGVELYAILKDEDEAALKQEASTTPSTTAAPASNNPFAQYVSILQQTINSGFKNLTQSIQNLVNQNQANFSNGTSSGFFQNIGSQINNALNFNNPSQAPNGTQSDEIPSRPTIWQGIQTSLQNFLTPGQPGNVPANAQADKPVASGGPISQAIQNNPFVQGVVNLFQPNKPQGAKPADAPVVAAATPDKEGSNIVPANSQSESNSASSESQQKPERVTVQEPTPLQDGPLLTMIKNNPIVKGISGTVQKLQNIGNPNKPRDEAVTEKQQDIKVQTEIKAQPEPKPEQELKPQPDVKGGFGYYGGGYGGHRPTSEHNNDGSSVKNVETEEKKADEKKEEDAVVPSEDKNEKPFSDKTE